MIWNDSFNIPVKTGEGAIKFEHYDYNNIGSDSHISTYDFPLHRLRDQEEHYETIQLESLKHRDDGQIRVKMTWSWCESVLLKEEYEEAKEKHEIAKKELDDIMK